MGCVFFIANMSFNWKIKSGFPTQSKNCAKKYVFASFICILNLKGRWIISTVFVFVRIFINWKGRVTNIHTHIWVCSYREREILQQLFHSLNGQNSGVWPGHISNQHPIRASPLGGRDLSPWAAFCCFPRCWRGCRAA